MRVVRSTGSNSNQLYTVYNNGGAWVGSAVGGKHAHDDGRWHHLAVVYDASAHTYSVYVDRSPTYTKTGVTIGSAEAEISPMTIGGRYSGGSYSRFFDGAIDAFRFTKTALGPDDFLRRSKGANGLIVIFK